MFVELPEGSDDGTRTLEVVGEGPAYELSVWFYDSGCNLMNLADGDPNEIGPAAAPIPEGARYAWVNLTAGTPTYLWATLK